MGEAVEEEALLPLVKGTHGLALGVDEGELGCELAEGGDGGGLVVDKDAAFAGGGDLAPKQDLVGLFGVVDTVGFKDGAGAGGALKGAADDGLFGAVADDVARGFAAEQEGERVDQDGFAGAGLAREEVEPGAELDGRTVDHSVVFRAQLQQHFPKPREARSSVGFRSARQAEDNKAGRRIGVWRGGQERGIQAGTFGSRERAPGAGASKYTGDQTTLCLFSSLLPSCCSRTKFRRRRLRLPRTRARLPR